jgi:hypothetical protein
VSEESDDLVIARRPGVLQLEEAAQCPGVGGRELVVSGLNETPS